MAYSNLIELLEEQTVVILHYKEKSATILVDSPKRLTSLSFINDQHLPSGWSLEDWCPFALIQERFIGSHENVKLEFCLSAHRRVVEYFIFANDISGCCFTVIGNGTDIRSPYLEFTHPVQDGRVGDNNKMRPNLLLHQLGEERDDLNRFTLERN